MKLLDELKNLLERDERLVSDDKLLKNRIVELALKLDKDLLKLLMSNNKIKEHFFIEIDKTIVFDNEKLMKFVDNKEFLPDSYTAFKNKIGLTADKKYLAKSKEVVLSWPYKDCILEGGQEKEEEKRKEVFHNEILAPDEIDRLLEPKVFTNFIRVNAKGENKVSDIKPNDNLIIKGNNLLVLHSLKKKYAGKVKLIYIDPPYNTGSDSFGYNDNFNHSTWLTFMRNRLEVARELLSKEGAIFVQCDHHEVGYLNLLMDEVFDVKNKVQLISIKTASPAGFKTVNPGPIDVTEYLLFYTKSKKDYNFKKSYVPVDYNKNYNLFVKKDKSVLNWKFTPINKKILEISGFKSDSEAKKKYGNLWKSIKKVMISDFAFENAENIVSIRDPHNPTNKVKELMEKSRNNGEMVIEHKRDDGSFLYLYKGGSLAFYSNKIKEIDGEKQVTELLTDFWNHISWAGIAREGAVKLKNGKKPEKLIKQILEMSTEKGDIVLDYHLGSGTTCASAHKLGRQYIGVEQLYYGENDSIVRLKNVINGDQSGISKTVNWNGGGTFVYCEFKQLNEEFVHKIRNAKDSKKLLKIWEEMKKHAFLSYRVDEKLFDENIEDFKELSAEQQKKLLVECLDANNLYVNYSEMQDSQYDVSKEDKKINERFYGGL